MALGTGACCLGEVGDDLNRCLPRYGVGVAGDEPIDRLPRRDGVRQQLELLVGNLPRKALIVVAGVPALGVIRPQFGGEGSAGHRVGVADKFAGVAVVLGEDVPAVAVDADGDDGLVARCAAVYVELSKGGRGEGDVALPAVAVGVGGEVEGKQVERLAVKVGGNLVVHDVSGEDGQVVGVTVVPASKRQGKAGGIPRHTAAGKRQRQAVRGWAQAARREVGRRRWQRQRVVLARRAHRALVAYRLAGAQRQAPAVLPRAAHQQRRDADTWRGTASQCWRGGGVCHGAGLDGGRGGASWRGAVGDGGIAADA